MTIDKKNVEQNWAELKGKIIAKWSKVSEADIEGVKGDLHQLSGKIQAAYGIAKEHADRQLEDFGSTVQALLGLPGAALPKPVLTMVAPAAIKPASGIARPLAVPTAPAGTAALLKNSKFS